jgi:hypothetical protein
MPRPSHSCDWMTRVIFWGGYISWSFSLCSLLYSPVISSLLGPNVFLCTLLICSFLSVRDQASHGGHHSPPSIAEILWPCTLFTPVLSPLFMMIPLRVPYVQ